MKKFFALSLLFLAFTGAAQSLRFWGNWDTTIELLPTVLIYESNLILDCAFAPGWRVESETKIYSGGVYKSQNFFVSGSLGDFSVWGKMYFHAQEVRYQKVWLNAETKFGDLTARISFNHWAKLADYTSTDRSMFGDWPCYTWVSQFPVIEANELVATWQGASDPRIGQKYYVHGTIVAWYPSSPTTYVNLYLVANYPAQRFIVYIRFSDFSPPITASDVLARLGATTWSEVVGKEICVFGTLVNYTSPAGVDNPEIVLANSPNQLNDLNVGACQPTLVAVPTEPFLNWRYHLTWGSYTVNVDLGDCCTGTTFRRLQVDATGLALCCGIFLDTTFAFTKSGFEKISFTTSDIPFLCCGMTAKISAEFTPTGKKVELQPSWRGLSGCFTVYGDVSFSANAIRGIEIYGFAITCYAGDIKLRTITAFNPDKIEDLTDITFYADEWEYLGLTYTGRGCCGGDVELTLEAWFGNKGLLFGFQRFKYDFELPITSSIVLFTKAQWNFAKASPLEWFDVGWEISF